MRVLIVGAGIAGLTLAVALRKRGHRVAVFEERPENMVVTEGLFLTLAPNGMNGLRAIGAFDQVRHAGITTVGMEILNASGRRLAFVDQGHYLEKFGAASCTIVRGELVAILLEHARAAGAEVLFGQKVGRCETGGDSGHVALEPEKVGSFDLLVAADGIGSTVRRTFFPHHPQPRYTGQLGTGGFVPAEIADTEGVMRMTFGRGAFFGYIKAARRPVYWFNSFSADSNWQMPNDPRAFARELRVMHAGDPDPNIRILSQVEAVAQAYPIYEMPPLPQWSRDRVVLIGDAAHAIGPHSGQGASLAIEDAVVLAACLTGSSGTASGLALFERLRKRRVAKVAAMTARTGAQKNPQHGAALWIRDRVVSLFVPFGARAMEKLFAFRADVTPLSTPGW
jgi:2-polyprenyl-6-methoxyphenol hydroxylase-like FAD-dependent oxidoreductase